MDKTNIEKLKLTTAMLLFGTIGIFVRYIPLPSSVIALARAFVGMLFLLMVICIRRTKISKEAIIKNWKPLFLSGAFLGMNWILLFEAYRYTSVATATLCYYLAPIIVIVAAPFLFKEKLTLKKGICTMVALFGMVCVSGVIQNGIPEAGELTGIAYGLGAAVLYAAIMLLNKKIQDISAYDKTIVQLGISTIILIPYCLFTENFTTFAWSLPVVGLLLLVGVLHTGITYYLYFGAIGALNAQTAAIISYLDPVVAVLISVFILREGMDIVGVVGAVLILGAALCSELEKKK